MSFTWQKTPRSSGPSVESHSGSLAPRPRAVAPFLVQFVMLAFLLLTTACGSDTSPTQGDTIRIISVVVTPATGEIRIGETLQLVASVQNGSGVTWGSSQMGVASVSGTGVVMGVGPGTAVITATSIDDQSMSASATIMVLMDPPEVTSSSPADTEVEVGIESAIMITFDQPVLAAQLTQAEIAVTDPSGQQVVGEVTYDEATRTATFTPTEPLTELATTYTMTVSGVQNVEGTVMSEPAVWTFTTEFLSPDFYYRLYNQFLGPDFVLDNFAGSPHCYMAVASVNTSGTFWHIQRIPGRSTYSMKSLFGGPDLALEGADGVGPCLLTGFPEGSFFSGQAWAFPPLPEAPGAYRLQNENLGEGKSLDNYNDGRVPEQAYMADTGLFSGQAWYFVRASRR